MSENIRVLIVFLSIVATFCGGFTLGRDIERYEERNRRREMYRHPAGKGR
jgi:hypothetical protein